MDHWSCIAMNKTRNDLLARKEELIKRLDAVRADLERGLEADAEEQALQLENLEVLQEISRLAEAELAAVNAELARLPPKS
jgi:RNA polymerase-binding transcription factor DksA